MVAARLFERSAVFDSAAFFGKLAFARQHHLIQLLSECKLVGGRMKAFVKATDPKARKLVLGIPDDGDCYLVVRFAGHHPVVQDKSVLVFHHALAHTQFDGYAGFPFTDPFGMRLEEGEHFFSMRDDFALNHATFDLLDLALGMDDKALYFLQASRIRPNLLQDG